MPASDRLTGRPLGVLMVLCGAIFLEGIDVAMLNVALPAIRAELGLSTAMLSGVVSAYVLGYGGFMLLGGRAADLLGRRRMFLLWLTVFLLFSGLGGFATEGWVLLVARFVTGVAAGFMTPAGLSLITTSFPEGPRRNRALLVYAGTAAAGFALGLVIGGLLTAIGWRWVFFAPVILAAAILLVAVPLLEEPAARPPAGRFDVLGAVTITTAMMLLVYGVVRLEHPLQGWGWTLAAFAGGTALVVAFVAVERRSPQPLIRLGILRSRPLMRANVSAGLLTAAFFGFQFLITLYLQELRGWSAIQTGLALLLAAADVVLAPTLTPILVNRYGNARVIFGGLVSGLVAFVLFLGVGMDWTYAAMLPSMLLIGVMFAFVYGPLTIAATDGVAEHEQGLAGALVNTSFQFGAALGLSAVTAVNQAALAAGENGLEALRAALVVPVAAVLLALAVTASGLRAGRPAEAPAQV